MGVAVFPPCSLASGQTMVGVMVVMATSFERTYAGMRHSSSVVVSVPDPVTGCCQPMPPPETPKHAQASLAQSLVGSQLLSPGSWCAHDFVCVLQESLFPQSCGGSIIKSADLPSQVPWRFSVPLGSLLWGLEFS